MSEANAMLPSTPTGTPAVLPQEGKEPSIAEFESLRDETLKRVEFRDRFATLAIGAAGAAITVGSSHNFHIVLSAYPILVLFLAAGFSYNTMLLIVIGRYLREEMSQKLPELGWAQYLHPEYASIEFLERVAKYGLFLGTPSLMLVFAFFQYGETFSNAEFGVFVAGWIAVVLTFV